MVGLEDLVPDGDLFQTVSDGTWTSTLNGDRLTYSAQHASPYAGRYTFVVPGVLGDPFTPEGDSYGTLQISTSGQVTSGGNPCADAPHATL